MDWIRLTANALWILAIALSLAAISRASWQASRHRTRFVSQLKQRGYRLSLNAAGIAFSLGLAGACANHLLALFWMTMATVFLGFMAATLLDSRKG